MTGVSRRVLFSLFLLTSVVGSGVSAQIDIAAVADGRALGNGTIQAGVSLSPMLPELRLVAPHFSRRDGRRKGQAKAEEERIYPRIEAENRRLLWKKTVLASATLAAAGALIGHWSSRRGDAAYDRYLESAGVQRRERAFDDAQRHDRIAGAAFLAMEAGLVLGAYFVFF